MEKKKTNSNPKALVVYLENLKKRIQKDGRRMGMTEDEIIQLQEDCETSIRATHYPNKGGRNRI